MPLRLIAPFYICKRLLLDTGSVCSLAEMFLKTFPSEEMETSLCALSRVNVKSGSASAIIRRKTIVKLQEKKKALLKYYRDFITLSTAGCSDFGTYILKFLLLEEMHSFSSLATYLHYIKHNYLGASTTPWVLNLTELNRLL